MGPSVTNANKFAADLRKRGATNVTVTTTRVGGLSTGAPLSHHVQAHYGDVSVRATFDADTGRFTWGVRTDVDPSVAKTLRTLKEVRQVLGLRPDKPWQVGSANGGKMREFPTLAAAYGEVARLHGEGQPAIVRMWDANAKGYVIRERLPVPSETTA